MKKYDKILLIQWINGIGDVIFTLPSYNVIRALYPEAELTYLVSKKYRPVIEGFAGLNKMLVFDRTVLKSKDLSAIYHLFRDLIQTLRQEKFDLIVDFTSSSESAWVAKLSGAPERWGILKKNRYLRALKYTSVVEKKPGIQLGALYLSILKKGGIDTDIARNNYQLPKEAIDKALRWFQEHQLAPEKPTLFIQPFTFIPRKNWPLENQIELAQYWQNKGVQVIFGGASNERERLSPVETRFPIAAGVDLMTTAGIMKQSSVIIGGDTGILHLATALGKRVVMLMGPTLPEQFGPYRHPEWAVRPVNSELMVNLSVKQVIEATEKAFQEVR